MRDELAEFSDLLERSHSQNLLDYQKEFLKFATDLNIAGLFLSEMKRWQFKPEVDPKLSGLQSLLIVDGSWFTLNLSQLNSVEQNADVLTHITDSLNYFISQTSFQRRELKNYKNADYSSNARAQLVDSGEVARGDILYFEADKTIHSFTSTKPIFAISIYSKAVKTHCWRFSAINGEPLSYVDNFAVHTTLGLMARLLGAYGGEESIECLEQLLVCTSDTVKWRAANAIACIDIEKGKKALNSLMGSNNKILKAAVNDAIVELEGDMK